MDSRKDADELINIMNSLSTLTSKAAVELKKAGDGLLAAGDKYQHIKIEVEKVLKEVDAKMPLFDDMTEDQIISTMVPLRNRFDKLKGDLNAIKSAPENPLSSASLAQIKDALLKISKFSPEFQTNLNALKVNELSLDNLNKLLPMSIKVVTAKGMIKYIDSFKQSLEALSKASSSYQQALSTIEKNYKGSVEKVFTDNKEVFDLVNEASPPAYTPVAAPQKLFKPASDQTNVRSDHSATSQRMLSQKR